MKKIFKSNKAKGKIAAPEPEGDAQFDSPGYSLKEKDLPKLHKAAWSGELAKVQQLIKKGDVNQLDKENRTALHLACAHGHTEVAAFLVSTKAKLNLCDNDQRSPLMKASHGNHIACVETLLRANADPTLVDKDGNTALHLSAHEGFVDAVLLLLRGGARVNAPNKNGNTPLHLCTEAKQDVMVEVLLDNDADVNATDNNNRTALMLACQSDQIGLVKLLLDHKADTEIKDSKGWTANDQAIMGGFHGCSHLIDEFNSSRRPRASASRPGSSMFGSTTGTEGVGLGFSLGGGGAKDDFYDDEDEISVGKDSFGEDSWAASASEVEEPVKPKPQISKAVKLSKFIAESDDDSVKSFDVSQRSTASKSRIPRAVSKDSLASAASNRSASRTNQDSSKIPRLSNKPSDPTAATSSPAKAKAAAGADKGGPAVSKPDLYPWDDTPTPTPRDDDGGTPRGGQFTPRSSAISVGESGSDWDDDDILGTLEGMSPKKMPNISEEKPNKAGSQTETRPLNSQDKQQRKDVLNRLGMSDIEDEEEDSSLHFTDEESKKAPILKQGIPPSPIVKAEESPIAARAPKTADDEDEESDWDSDDDLLPSNASDFKDPPVVKPGDASIHSNSESLDSKPQLAAQHAPAISPRIERKLPPTPTKGAPGRDDDIGQAGKDLAEAERAKDGEEEDEAIDGDDDDDDWDSDEDDEEEEESEWEKARKIGRRASIHEELKQAQKTEGNRQRIWEEEEAKREEKRKEEAAAELRREQEEIERERQQREEEERLEREREQEERQERERREAKRRAEEEEDRARQEVEKQKQEEAEQRQRDENERAAEEKRRKLEEEHLQKAEQELKERQREDNRQRKERRKKEEEQRAEEKQRQKLEEERLKKIEQEMKEKHFEEERQREERKIKDEEERKQREEELKEEMEKMKTVEERNEAERQHLEKERKRLEEERKQEELRRDEEKKRLEMEAKIEMERIEVERAKLEAERHAEQKQLEEERKKMEDTQKFEKRMLEEARHKLEDEIKLRDEENERNKEERLRLEKEKDEVKTLRLQQEEAKQRLEDDRRREEDRFKFEEDRIKRENERLQIERKKVEEEAKNRQRDLLQGISSKSETEKKQFEDELARLEDERKQELKRREEEFEAERLRQTAEKNALQKELDLQSLRFKEERLKFEARQKEAERQREQEESRREDELKKLTEEQTREMEQLKAEKQRLIKENEDIERKKGEILTMKREAEKKESERNLLRYQKSIEKRLQDEEDVVTADGDHSSDMDVDHYEMEVAVIQKQRQDLQGMSPVLSGSRDQNVNRNNGLDSQGNTADFNQGLIGHSPHNPLHSTAARRSQKPAGSHYALTNGNAYGLPAKQPAWQAILNEPDGLDSSSTDEDVDDDPAAAEELRASYLSQFLSSAPLALNTNQNAGGTSQPDDPTVVLRLQGQLREQKRIADREKGLRVNAENHCRALEGDIDEMHRRVEESTQTRAALDQHLLDMEARIRTLEHELSQEMEMRQNAEVLLGKTKEQLMRKEELYAHEIEAKQKSELGSRNLGLELRTAQNLVRQFEEERDELRSQLLHEKHARALHEELVHDQLQAQDVLHQETSKFFAEKAEAVSRLEAADESRKVVLNQSDRLKTELSALRVELERQRMRHRDDQGMLTSENEELSNKIEELKNDIRVSEEALAHATMAFNSQLMAVKTENAMLHGAVEKEMNAADKLQTKLDSVERRLQSTTQELEKSQQARTDLERNFQRDRDEWHRSRDKMGTEIISLRDSAQAANKKSVATEGKLHSIEKELQVAGTQLMERSNQLASLQRELDSRNTRQNSHDSLLQREKEDNYKISARMESLVERLNDAQNESSKLRRALEASQQEKMQRDKDMLDAQEKFNNTLKTLQADNDRSRTVWEERLSTASDNISRLKEELQRSEHTRSMRDQEIRQIQQELTEALRKLSIAEANWDITKKTQNDLDKEKQQQGHHMKQLQDQLSSMERDRRSLEARIEELQSDLMKTQRNNLNTSQQLMATQTSLHKKSELEERLKELEAENARMEATIKLERDRGNSLQREAQDSNKMRESLEDLVSNLQTTSMRMEGKLQEETANRSLFAKEAEDHKGLWELEVKSRSRLGLRIAQLERSKAEALALVDEEKKKVRKMAEIKRSYEERWQSETQRTQLLEQEISTLKAKMKAAKRKLKDLDAPELRLNTLQAGFERERLNTEATLATQRRQIDDLNQQLEREASLRVDVEKNNRVLQQGLASSKTIEKGKDKLEKSKRKLEEELAQMKMIVQQNFIEKGELEKYKQQLDAKARMEVNEKLDQVNTYLEEQSQAREKLEMLRNSNENELKKEQENMINDLKNEVGRLRSSYHDMLAQKETMEVEVARFKELYQDAMKKQDKLTAQLDKAQDKLLDTQAKFTLQKQRNRQMQDGSLDLSPRHLTKKPTSQSPHIDSITEKVWSELDKSITRHLQAAPTDVSSSLAELRASSLSRSYDGSNSPLRHDNNQYLATLRKNYFV